jgi:hypothetical protein
MSHRESVHHAPEAMVLAELESGDAVTVDQLMGFEYEISAPKSSSKAESDV